MSGEARGGGPVPAKATVSANTTVPAKATAAAEPTVSAKPTVAELGIDVSAQHWRRSGGDAAIEVAFVGFPGDNGESATSPASRPDVGEWVLMRVAGDPAERVLVYNRLEWECFLDGAKNGEFDNAT